MEVFTYVTATTSPTPIKPITNQKQIALTNRTVLTDQKALNASVREFNTNYCVC